MLKIIPKSIDWGEVGRSGFEKKFQSDPAVFMHRLTEAIPHQLLNAEWLNLHHITTKQHQYRLISVVLTAAINAQTTDSTSRFIRTLAQAGVFSSLPPLDTKSCFFKLDPPKEKGMNDPCRILGETLSYCIQKGDETVASLLIDEITLNNELFLLKACRHNLPQIVTKIASRLSEETKAATFTHGLVLCCEKGALETLKTLLSLGANPLSDHNGVYPVHAACKNLESDCLNALLPYLNETGLNAREEMTGHTPLQVLFTRLERSYDMEQRARDNLKTLSMASLILAHGADPSAPFGLESSILHDLCGRWSVFPSEVAFVKLLIDAGLNPTSPGRRGSPINRLFQSQPAGGAELFKLLLMKGETPYWTKDQNITWIEQFFCRKTTRFLDEFFLSYSATLSNLFLAAAGYADFVAAVKESAQKIVEDCRQKEKNPLELAWIMQQPTIEDTAKSTLSAPEINELEEEMELHFPHRFL
ncbi:ankyrin repeat domain-containing protein [Estrella lausannensis]|uniref:Ankyrin repeat-containing protein n=1 Tax=Estrella lausannensis TaxID=483423 RepID=A0A0H5DQI5_9BACT|nr:ankyrin repeat domain-containing protein [Estrella lausannensis]CRX38916.1 hypothetical protein ELAC_1588 [Estrella lausannensis]